MTKNSYPYYIPVILEGGIIKKIFRNKKFFVLHDVETALFNRWKHLKSSNRLNITDQILILKYSNEYKCYIVKIYSPLSKDTTTIEYNINDNI